MPVKPGKKKTSVSRKKPVSRAARKPSTRSSTGGGSGSPIDRLRAICLALPEAHEVEAWSEPTFRVKNKIFAMYADSDTHHGAGRPCVWLKSTHLIQDMLVHEDADRYFAPPYVGPKGWLGIRIDRRPNWASVADLVRDAYLLTAPKRIAALLDEG